jgi:hypothetical protein
MIKGATAFFQEFNTFIKTCEMFCSIARDSELQRDACRKLEFKILEIHEEKNCAIENQDEDYANSLLGCACAAKAVLSELRMWLLLKEEKPENAWDELINAQDALQAAIRAHRGFLHLSKPIKRLDVIEKIIFPPQMFMSSGLLVRTQLCSICGSDYDDCHHVAGRPYMGQFCAIVAEGLEADHVAIVDIPADKRCRVISFETKEGYRNRMTWKLEKQSESEPANTNAEPPDTESGLRARGIIMRFD